MKKKNGLPDRWLAYKNMGERIAGTPFIAFKVPLGENFFSRMRISDRFTPDELVDANPDMRLVIDLTNTQRYYSMESIKRKGVKYCKLSCPGRMVPTDRLISRFCDIVHDFLSSCSINGQDTIIGVHCTHGVNRTGFMICSFMIRHLLMHPREAIRVFETARGHTIEREEYVEALIRQYSRNMAQRKRKTPPRGIPRMRSMGDTGDGRQSSLQREDPAYDGVARKKTTSSHLAPHQPQGQSLPQLPSQHLRQPWPRPQPRRYLPYVPSPSPFPSSAERGFGRGVGRERGRGWGRARGDGRAGGSWRQAGGRDEQHGHGWGGRGRARGHGYEPCRERGRGRGHAGRPWNHNRRSNAPTGAE